MQETYLQLIMKDKIDNTYNYVKKNFKKDISEPFIKIIDKI